MSLVDRPISGFNWEKEATQIMTSNNPDKVIQDVLKRQENAKCADCYAPAPQCVNLTMAAVVCKRCAAVVKNFGFRVKEWGSASFTREEADFMDNSKGNLFVNEIWLSSHPDVLSIGKWTSPEDAAAFLARKYVERAWQRPMAPPTPPPSLTVSTARPRNGSVTRETNSPGPTSRPASPNSGRPPLPPPSIGTARGRASSLPNTPSSLSPSRFDISMMPIVGSRAAASAGGAPTLYTSRSSMNSSDESMSREDLFRLLEKFYLAHNKSKLIQLEVFVEWIDRHGLDAFNQKLMDRYGEDLTEYLAEVASGPAPAASAPGLFSRLSRRRRSNSGGETQRFRSSSLMDSTTDLSRLEAAALEMSSRPAQASANPFDGEDGFDNYNEDDDDKPNPFDSL